MTDREHQRLIALVDAASHRDEPLLSSVLTVGDPQLAEAYRLSANLFGGYLPADDREVWLRMSTDRSSVAVWTIEQWWAFSGELPGATPPPV
nr:hypothetical protein StreXyl84_77590 [Streptomyces sp. Xyl84]